MQGLELEGLETRLAPAVYYVATFGNDLADGLSPETAWAGVNRVNTQDFSPGDHVLFNGGDTFSGRVTLTAEDSGISSAPILLGSYGLGRATLNGLTAGDVDHLSLTDLIFAGPGQTPDWGPESRDGVVLNANQAGQTVDNLVVLNVEVFNWPRFGFAIGGTVPGAGFLYPLVADSVFHDIYHVGLFSWTADNAPTHEGMTFARCEVYNVTTLGIAMSGVHDGLIWDCVAHDVGQTYLFATDAGPVGIIVYASDVVRILDCEAYNVSNGLATYDGDGIGFDWGVTNSIIENCYAHDNDGPGFYIYSGDLSIQSTNNIFRNNLSVNDGHSSGLNAAFFAGSYAFDTLFEDNVAIGAPQGLLVWAPATVIENGNSWN